MGDGVIIMDTAVAPPTIKSPIVSSNNTIIIQILSYSKLQGQQLDSPVRPWVSIQSKTFDKSRQLNQIDSTLT